MKEKIVGAKWTRKEDNGRTGNDSRNDPTWSFSFARRFDESRYDAMILEEFFIPTLTRSRVDFCRLLSAVELVCSVWKISSVSKREKKSKKRKSYSCLFTRVGCARVMGDVYRLVSDLLVKDTPTDRRKIDLTLPLARVSLLNLSSR